MAARPRPLGAWAGLSLSSSRPRDRAGRPGGLRNRPAPGGYGDARVLGAAPPAAGNAVGAGRPVALDPHLSELHGRLRGAGRATGAAARPQLAGGEDRADPRGAADDDAAGGGRYRTAVHLGQPRPAGGASEGVGGTHRLLHHRGGDRPGVRLHAFPGGHSGGGAAQPRQAGRSHRPEPRGRPVAGSGAGDAAAGNTRSGSGHGPGPGPEPGRVRGDHRLRRLQGGRHPHDAAGHLPGAGEGHGHLPGPGRRAHRPVLHHRRGDQHRLGQGGLPPTAPRRAPGAPGPRRRCVGAPRRAGLLPRRGRADSRVTSGRRTRRGPAGGL